MDLAISEQQALVGESVARFFERHYSFAQRRQSVAQFNGFNPEIWTGLAELGLLALPFPDEIGGLGGDNLSFGLAMRAAGRHLVVEPLIPVICLAGGVVGLLGNADQLHTWLDPLMAGESLLALVDMERDGGLRVDPNGDGWTLTGHTSLVPAGAAANGLTVCAKDPDGRLRIFLMSAETAGIRRTTIRLTDQSSAAKIEFDAVCVDAGAELRGDVSTALLKARRSALVAACWEAVGAMSAMLEQTVEYVSQRHQFGKAIATFQAVQHNLAEMAVAYEEALAAVMLAALVPLVDEAGRSRAASVAKIKVAASADIVAKTAVQLHGGMGVSDELPIASYFRKLLAFSVLHGSTASHLESIVDQVIAKGKHLNSPILVPLSKGESG